MAYIKEANGYKVGDTVTLKRDHESLSGVFEAGTVVQITGQGAYGYSIKDEFGNEMYDCGWDL